jgi:hypothetical protein
MVLKLQNQYCDNVLCINKCTSKYLLTCMAHITLGYCIYFSTSFVNWKSWENWFFQFFKVAILLSEVQFVERYTMFDPEMHCHYTITWAWVVLSHNCKWLHFFVGKISPCSTVNTVYAETTDPYMCIHTTSLSLGQNPQHDMLWNVLTVCQVHFSYHIALWYGMNDTCTVFFNSSRKSKSRFS